MRKIGLLILSVLTMAGAALAQTGDEPDPSPPDPGRVRAGAAEMRADVMQPGELVPNWNVGSADPLRDLREMGGEAHYLFSRTEDADSLAIASDRAIVDFAPDDWVVVDSYRFHNPALTNAAVEFVPLSHRFVFGMRSAPRRVGDVDCWDNLDHALLFYRPGAVGSPADDHAWEDFRVIILALEDQDLCVRYEGSRDDVYTSQTFAPDGRRLPRLDSPGEEAWIVDARSIDHYVAYRAADGFPPPDLAD